MCVYIKSNVKCISLFVLLIFLIIRNLLVCVYVPVSEFVCENNISFKIVPSKCHKNVVMDNIYYSECLWIGKDEIHQYLCNETLIERITCKEVTTNKSLIKERLDLPVSECTPINHTHNFSIVFDVFYNLNYNQRTRYTIVTCNLHQGSNINTVDNIKIDYVNYTNTTVKDDSLCFDGQKRVTFFTVHLFCNDPSNNPIINVNNIRMVLDYGILIFAITLHVITLTVFLLVTRLQAGYGKSVMSYILAQLIRKAALIVMMNVLDDIHEYQNVTIYGAFHLSADLVAHLWQIFITFQIWNAFRCTRQRKSTKLLPKTFAIIAAIIWGVPCFLVMIYFIISEHFLSDQTFWVPASICETSVLMALELTAMSLSGATLVNLRASRTCRSSLKGAESRSHNTAEVQWSSLYMKIVLLAGADYVFVMIFFLVDSLLAFTDNSLVSEIAYYVMWDIYSMRGVEMLFIFVLKEDVWEQLKMHLFHKK